MAKIRDVRPAMNANTIMLGGRMRTIQLDLNAFGELENRYGSIQEAMAQLNSGKMKDVKVILWAGLLHDEVNLDPITGEPISYNITPYQVGGWVNTPQLFEEVSRMLNAAIGDNLPDPANMAQNVVDIVGKEQEALPSNVATVVLTDEEIAENAKNG